MSDGAVLWHGAQDSPSEAVGDAVDHVVEVEVVLERGWHRALGLVGTCRSRTRRARSRGWVRGGLTRGARELLIDGRAGGGEGKGSTGWLMIERARLTVDGAG